MQRTSTFNVNVSVKVTQPCPPGSYSVSLSGDNSMSACVPCLPGFWQSNSSATSCTPCDSRLPITLQQGAYSSDLCTADVGSYEANGISHPCPYGASCTRKGETLETLDILPGFWRSDPASATILKCAQPIYCPGINYSSSSALVTQRRELDVANANFSVQICVAHQTGPLCESCVPGYVKRGSNAICSLLYTHLPRQGAWRLKLIPQH